MTERRPAQWATADHVIGSGGTKEMFVLAANIKPGDKMVLYRKMCVVDSVESVDDALVKVRVSRINNEGAAMSRAYYNWDKKRKFLVRRPVENL